MRKPTECPSANVLEEFVGGKLVDSQANDLSKHLEDCASCQERAKTLSPHDTLVESLRAKSVAADAIAGAIPRPLVEKLKHLSPDKSLANSDTIGVSVDAAPGSRDAELNFLSPAQQPDEIGRLGHYRVLKVLGKGGMGVVFLADDPKLDRQVALKVMLPKVAINPSAKDRFLREARAAAKLKNDHIVTIYQVDEVNGVPFLAMELLEGKPLDDYLRDGRSLTVGQIIRIARDTAKGLSAAHEKSLIHRDIKPANLWLDHTNGGRVKILDFGLARSEKDDVHLTQSGTIVGTPAFMAPEQAHGEKTVDGRADLFSLGCVLYRLCVGDIPFKSETTMGMLLAIATKHPKAPIESNATIPLALSELTMQLLDKDPARRPASAREVITRLNEIERNLSARSAQIEVAQLAPAPGSTATATEITKASDIVPAPAPATKRSRPGLGWLVVPALALLLLGGGAFGIYQLFFNTPNGRIVVEINDDDIEARFKKGKIELYDNAGKLLYTLEPSQRAKDLPPGNYGIKVAGADGLELDTDKFEMKRGGKVVVRILLDRVALAKKEVEIKPVKDGPPGNGMFALEFDGQTTHVEIPTLTRNEPGPITLEAFVSPNPSSTGVNLIRLSGKYFCQIHAWANGPGKTLIPNVGYNGGKLTGTSRPHLPMRQRTHVAAQIDDKHVEIFIDGKPYDKAPYTPKLFDGDPGPSLLGCFKDPGKPATWFFAGILAEVRISKSLRYNGPFTPKARLTPDADTLALYHMDEGQGDKLTDSSGNGHHGKIVGAKWARIDDTAPQVPPGNYALEFDGDAFVKLPELKTKYPIRPRDPFTLEAWAKPTQAKSRDGRPENRPYVIFSDSYNSGIYIELGKKKWAGAVYNLPRSYSIKPAELSRPVRLAVTFDGELLRLFVDGKLENTEPLKQSSFFRGSLSIGNNFIGQIDDIRISTVCRYITDYSPGRPEKDADTLALYHCDEGSGDKLTDSSGNGHHGKIIGAKWVKADGPPIALARQFVLQYDGKAQVDVPSLSIEEHAEVTLEGYFDVTTQRRKSFTFLGNDWMNFNYYQPTGRLDVKLPGFANFSRLEVPERRTHIALVLTPKEATMFFDGVKIGHGKRPSQGKKESSKVFVVGGNGLEGSISEVRVSKVARYKENFTPAKRHEPDTDTLALYHFDEGQGDKLTDSSGNGHHGKIVGAKWIATHREEVRPDPAGPFVLKFDEKSRVTVPTLHLDLHRPMTLEGFVTQEGPGQNTSLFGMNLINIRGGVNTTWSIHYRPENSPTMTFAQTDIAVQNGKRTHVAVVVANDTLRFFVDGVLALQKDNKEISLTKNKQNLEMGFGFTGVISEVRVSKTARYDKNFTPARRFTPDADTLALYHMDDGQGDKLTDSSSNGHHGKIVGAKWVKADGAPAAPFALRFESGDTVECPKIDGSHPDFTLEGWFVAEPETLAKAPASGYISMTNQAVLSFHIPGAWRLATYNGKGGAMFGTQGPKKAQTSVWTHVATVRKGDHATVYVNGKIEKQDVGKPIVPLGGYPFHLSDKKVVGSMREIRISKVARYDKEFSPAQRHEPDADTLALYHCDEGQGDKLVDSSGNGHHGKIVGAKWVKADGPPGRPNPGPSTHELDFQATTTVEVPSLKLTESGPITIEAALTRDPSSRPGAHFVGLPRGLRMRTRGTNHVGFLWGEFNNTKQDPMAIDGGGFPIPAKRIELALVYTGKEVLAFRDGKLLGRADSGAYDPRGDKGVFTIGGGLLGRLHGLRVSKVARYTADYTPVTRLATDADTLALYHFDEGSGDVLTDSSGNGHHGKIVGAKWVKADGAAVAPRVGNSLLFDGKASAVKADPPVWNATDPLTLEAYVTPRSLDEGTIINLRTPSLARLYIQKGKWHAMAVSVDGASNIRITETAVDLNQKVHVAGVWTGNNFSIFVNGKRQAGKDLIQKLPGGLTAAQMSFGVDFFTKKNFFDGNIQEIRLSKIARYNKDFTPQNRFEPDADTLALYHFDEGQGDKLTDSSGNGHHGTIVGAKWVKADE